MDQQQDRLSPWQWAELYASVSIFSVTLGWAYIRLTHQDPWGDIRWVEYGVGYVIFFTGFSTLFRYLRMRRHRKRG